MSEIIREYKTKEDVLKRAQEAIGIPFGEIDKTGRLSTGKGAIGTVLEESWFGYTPNSESEPDFPEAGVELKVTPFLRTRTGIRAKERLVCNIINYMTEYQKTFKTSDFWHKCENMLIMSYEHIPNLEKKDYSIEKAILFTFPEEDLVIIEQDWEKIIGKIRSGQAHLITEGDTLYLAACTKGANASTLRPQPFSEIKAKQRAYSLKSSYMTRILNEYIFGSKEDEHIIKDWHALTNRSFEDLVKDRLRVYIGLSRSQLMRRFGISYDKRPKHINSLLLSHMFDIKGNVANTTEFRNASIVPKTVEIRRSGTIDESISFPAFKFCEIINETWEDSELKNTLEPNKYMFVIFREHDDGEYYFEDVVFWNIPADDLEEVHKVWERTVETIKRGVKLEEINGIVYNDLPKQSENRVAHVRPHGKAKLDTYPLPDGREMTKQSFWLNRGYIRSVIEGAIGDKYYKKEDHLLYKVAESPEKYKVSEDGEQIGPIKE